MLDLCLVKNAEVYAPAKTGKRTLVTSGGTIIGMVSTEEELARVQAVCSREVDATGLAAVPGFVDIHQHLCGGGGEAGPASRTPEAKLSELLNAGITTVVGTLGTDSVSRSPEALVTKCRALRQDGITAFHWGGSGYRCPAGAITASIQKDMALLEWCLGVGEIAISDHRGSFPTPLELVQLAAEVRVGGMLAGKPGVVHCHVGPGKGMLQPLRDALASSSGDLPITQFLPTHMERSAALVDDAAAWLAEGGRVDFTADSHRCRHALCTIYKRGLPLERCSVSTDAYGSLPRFNSQGTLVEYHVADPGAMPRFLASMCAVDGLEARPGGEPVWPLERALPLLTCNPADALGLRGKGRLEVGADADIVLLDPASCEVVCVLARGEVVKTREWVRGGMFERGPGIRPRAPPGA